jgi:hypothetical protein
MGEESTGLSVVDDPMEVDGSNATDDSVGLKAPPAVEGWSDASADAMAHGVVTAPTGKECLAKDRACFGAGVMQDVRRIGVINRSIDLINAEQRQFTAGVQAWSKDEYGAQLPSTAMFQLMRVYASSNAARPPPAAASFAAIEQAASQASLRPSAQSIARVAELKAEAAAASLTWCAAAGEKFDGAVVELGHAETALVQAELNVARAAARWGQVNDLDKARFNFLTGAASTTTTSTDATNWMQVARAQQLSQKGAHEAAKLHVLVSADLMNAQEMLTSAGCYSSMHMNLEMASDDVVPRFFSMKELYEDRDRMLVCCPFDSVAPGDGAKEKDGREPVRLTADGCLGRRNAGRLIAAVEVQGFGSRLDEDFSSAFSKWGPAPELLTNAASNAAKFQPDGGVPDWELEQSAFLPTANGKSATPAKSEAMAALVVRQAEAARAGDSRELFAPGCFVARTADDAVVLDDGSMLPLAGKILPDGRKIWDYISYKIYDDIQAWREAYFLSVYPTLVYAKGHPMCGEFVGDGVGSTLSHGLGGFAPCPSEDGVVPAVSREECVDVAQDVRRSNVPGTLERDPSRRFNQYGMGAYAHWLRQRGMHAALTVADTCNQWGCFYSWGSGFCQVIPRSDPSLSLTLEQMMDPVATLEAFVLSATGLADQVSWRACFFAMWKIGED